MRSQVFLLPLFLSLLASPLLSLAQTPSPEFLLSQLSSASREQSYRGVFSFEQGGKIETFGVEHLVHQGREYERLFRTTGPRQAFSRQSELTCGTIGGKLLKGLQLTSSKGGVFGLSHFYRIALSGEDRVAGREAWVVHLVPTDAYRYGMALTIDKETQLLLRYVVFDAQKNIALERMQFASLLLDISLDNVPEFDTSELAVATRQCANDTLALSTSSPWRPTWLPPGFLRVAHEYSELHGHVESYTDGLSSFSVFISGMFDGASSDDALSISELFESANVTTVAPDKARGLLLQGVSSRGATTALLSLIPRPKGTLSVSVVGEIPARVAQRITLSVTHIHGETKEPSP